MESYFVALRIQHDHGHRSEHAEKVDKLPPLSCEEALVHMGLYEHELNEDLIEAFNGDLFLTDKAFNEEGLRDYLAWCADDPRRQIKFFYDKPMIGGSEELGFGVPLKLFTGDVFALMIIEREAAINFSPFRIQQSDVSLYSCVAVDEKEKLDDAVKTCNAHIPHNPSNINEAYLSEKVQASIETIDAYVEEFFSHLPYEIDKGLEFLVHDWVASDRHYFCFAVNDYEYTDEQYVFLTKNGSTITVTYPDINGFLMSHGADSLAQLELFNQYLQDALPDGYSLDIQWDCANGYKVSNKLLLVLAGPDWRDDKVDADTKASFSNPQTFANYLKKHGINFIEYNNFKTWSESAPLARTYSCLNEESCDVINFQIHNFDCNDSSELDAWVSTLESALNVKGECIEEYTQDWDFIGHGERDKYHSCQLEYPSYVGTYRFTFID
ncbi:hypothetical protein [Neptuniibacter sp. QD37_11]|uniref:hypothetical protein n=1 Tax=Neptuniibacter sp. QD37_11 TaxID=3398209 RepID=UPI0039F52020